MVIALLLGGVARFAPTIVAFCAPTNEPAIATNPNLPLAFVAGDLTLAPIQARFDYPRRVFSGDPSIDLRPIFFCKFQITGAKTTGIKVASTTL